jgi:hypothetical protein
MSSHSSTRALVFVLLCFALCLCAVAGESPMDKALAKTDREPVKGSPELAGSNPAIPVAASDVVLSDPATRQKYFVAMQRFYEYRANGYAYRSRVFEWQLLSSRMIFIIVLVLVSAGVYFAAMQFHVAMLTARRNVLNPSVTAIPPSENPLATHLELSAKGVVVNSSVLGVIILGLSLAFFYLYLVYVYPIQNVF